MPSNDVFITKIGAFMPNAAVSNNDMEAVLGQIGERPSRARKLILRSNRIKERYYAIDPKTGKPNYTNAQLAAESIKLLNDDQRDINDATLMACSTTMADQLMPNHAVMVQGELKSTPAEVVSTAGVCVCGVTAMKYAYLGIKSGEHDNAIACASETSSAIMKADRFFAESEDRIEALEAQPEIAFEKDFLRWMLSDGAGACWLSNKANESGLSLKVDWVDVLSYANEMSACMYAGAVKNADGSLSSWKELPVADDQTESCMTVTQDVKQLNEYVLLYTVEKPLAQIAEKRGIKPEDYDYFLPHFSSGYFEDKVFDSLERINFTIPKEKWFTNLFTKGNTGSASIYIILEELFNSGDLKRGEKILCYVPESGRFSTAFIQLTVV